MSPLYGLLQDADLLSPGILVSTAPCPSGSSSLESSRHLSRSNVDIPHSNGAEDSRKQLPRKRSDSSTYELDTIQQHQAFLSRWAQPAGLRVPTPGPTPGEGGGYRRMDSSELEKSGGLCGEAGPCHCQKCPGSCTGSSLSFLSLGFQKACPLSRAMAVTSGTAIPASTPAC